MVLFKELIVWICCYKKTHCRNGPVATTEIKTEHLTGVRLEVGKRELTGWFPLSPFL